MRRKELTSTVDTNGVLTLSAEVGPEWAGRTVRVIVEAEENGSRPTTLEEWRRFVERVAGSITDPSFERQPQGDYEQRDPLP